MRLLSCRVIVINRNMIFLSKFIKSKRKRWFIAFVVIINIVGIINIAYSFYFKKKLFDSSRTPQVSSNQITKLEIKEGSWNWGDKVWKFSRDTKLILSNRNDIDSFCVVLSSLPAKYIENIRGDDWLDIYFEENGSNKLAITLKYNHQKEVFIEYNDETYDGTILAKTIKELANKYGK